jgi:hypothetical protein
VLAVRTSPVIGLVLYCTQNIDSASIAAMERPPATPFITSPEAARLLRISEEMFLREVNSRRIVFSTTTSPDTGETLFLLSDVVYLLQKFTEVPP